MNTKQQQLLAFFGHHKGATGWINSIIMQICFDLGLNHLIAHNPEHFDYNLTKFTTQRKIDFISYTNANFDYVKYLHNFRGFHVVRDPRDILVSAYFSHLYSHPTAQWQELEEHRSKLLNVTKSEGLLLEIEFNKSRFEEMYRWNYNLPNVLEIKMEILTNNPDKIFAKILDFLGILNAGNLDLGQRVFYTNAILMNNLCRKFINRVIFHAPIVPFGIPVHEIPLERLFEIISKNEFSKKAGNRKRGEENVKSHYRKGVPGDWRNHFNEKHIKIFKYHYNDLLVKLGYELDDDWL